MFDYNCGQCKKMVGDITIYKYNFSLDIGDQIIINGIACTYLGLGIFGTNEELPKENIEKK